MFVKTAEDIAAYSRERRNELGWSQQTLADKVGVNRSWIIDFERGKASFEIGLVLKTLRARAGRESLLLRINLEYRIRTALREHSMEVMNIEGIHVFVARRYDRTPDGTRRIHQETSARH